MERMDEEHMAKVVNIIVQGNRCRNRPWLGWMDGVKRALGKKGMSVEQGRQNALDRRRWESIMINAFIVCRFVVYKPLHDVGWVLPEV